MKFKPKQHGSPIINHKCSECGGMFSEYGGHSCGEDDEGYY